MENTLINDLKSLRLLYLADNMNEFVSGCKKQKDIKIEGIIERMVEREIIDKSQRGTQRKLKQAKLGKFKNMSEFDWAFPSKADRDSIERLMTTDFMGSKKNVIMIGAQGLGKTMISKNIAFQAIMKGKTALFTTASRMVMALKGHDSQLDLTKAIKKYTKPDLLVLDELGYLSYDCQAADLIFEIINQRYEEGSIIITTNLAFKDWNNIFPGAACLTAMIDRLTHHVEVVKLEGDSYRLKESKKSR